MVHFRRVEEVQSRDTTARTATADRVYRRGGVAFRGVESGVRRAPHRRVVSGVLAGPPLGRLRVGALLIGVNRRKHVRWVTLSRVITCSPGQEIGWVVLINRSEWRYQLQPSATGTSITHIRRTPRGESRFALLFTQALLGGQACHDAELEQGMNQGLGRIKAIVEALPSR